MHFFKTILSCLEGDSDEDEEEDEDDDGDDDNEDEGDEDELWHHQTANWLPHLFKCSQTSISAERPVESFLDFFAGTKQHLQIILSVRTSLLGAYAFHTWILKSIGCLGFFMVVYPNFKNSNCKY